MDQETLDFTAIDPWLPDDEIKPAKGMLALLKHCSTNQRIVVGNAHLEHRP